MSTLGALSVIIPSYNACSLLRRSLRALENAAREAEVIVVDGASTDGSVDMVRSEFPWVRVLAHKNHGFSHAVNRGIESSTKPFVLLLNSDLFVRRSVLSSMLMRLRADAELGAVAPTLINEDGSKQDIFGPFYWPNWLDIADPTPVWLLSAACMMTRRSVIDRVGALDENFFLYNEEYDWCARARKAGFRLELIPDRVVHVGGGSTRRSPELTLEAQRGFLYLAHKHAPWWVVEGLRRAMQLEGFCYARIDPREGHRKMWAKLEGLARRESYIESPFTLSGRGEAVARPYGLASKPQGVARAAEETVSATTRSTPHAERGLHEVRAISPLSSRVAR